jgi:hypothetical protein
MHGGDNTKTPRRGENGFCVATALRAKNTKPVSAWAVRMDEWMADSGFVKR